MIQYFRHPCLSSVFPFKQTSRVFFIHHQKLTCGNMDLSECIRYAPHFPLVSQPILINSLSNYTFLNGHRSIGYVFECTSCDMATNLLN